MNASGCETSSSDEKPDGQGCRLHSAEGIPEGRRLVEVIINQAHSTIGHFGQFHTSRYIQRYYWWPSMGTDIELFCSSCDFVPSHEGLQSETQQVTALTTNTQSTMAVNRDGLHGTITHVQSYDYLLVVIDRLTSQVHLVLTTTHALPPKRLRGSSSRKLVRLPWNPRLHHIRPGYEVHFQLLEGTNIGSWGPSSLCPQHSIHRRMVQLSGPIVRWPSIASSSLQRPKRLGQNIAQSLSSHSTATSA